MKHDEFQVKGHRFLFLAMKAEKYGVEGLGCVHFELRKCFLPLEKWSHFEYTIGI